MSALFIYIRPTKRQNYCIVGRSKIQDPISSTHQPAPWPWRPWRPWRPWPPNDTPILFSHSLVQLVSRQGRAANVEAHLQALHLKVIRSQKDDVGQDLAPAIRRTTRSRPMLCQKLRFGRTTATRLTRGKSDQRKGRTERTGLKGQGRGQKPVWREAPNLRRSGRAKSKPTDRPKV